MKQNYILITFFLMFSITWINAQTLDVDYSLSNCPAPFTLAQGQTIGQSFTAGISGNLTTVKVGISANNLCAEITTMNCLATLYSGTCIGGTVLTTQNFSIPTSQPFSMYPIDFTTPASISSGQTYTLMLSVVSSPTQTCASGSGSTPLRLRWTLSVLCDVGYPYGTSYWSPCVSRPYDFFIQTYVTTGVPGCTDVAACNYNASATVSNGSCTYASTWYIDTDGDGYGAGTATNACAQPSGYVAANTDCNNTNPAVNPAATEICNSIDDNCDGQIYEGLTFTNYYADTDGDGYGAGTATNACAQPTGYVTNSSDCNNSNAAVNPAATEICNSIDDDCDTQIDEGLTFTNYYADSDGDGFGAGTATNACAQPTGYVINNTDCNDTNIAISPTTVWYLNADGDGYYVSTIVSCTSPGANYNTTGGTAGDCNDTNAAVHTGATETCNGIDDDCDGMIDENSSNTY